MPETWKTYKLGELTVWKSGGTPSKSKPEYWGGEIPWISAKSLKGRYVNDSELKVTKAGLKKGTKLATKGSILLLVRGSGLYNYIPVAMASKDVSYNQDVKCILPSNNLLSNEFLLYWFKGNKQTLSHLLEATSIGAGKFDMDRLLNLKFKLPPLSEQKSIASNLSALDDKIELNLQMNKTLREMATALYKHWFVDFGPFQDGKFIDSELGEIPKGWEVKRLDEFALKKSESFNFKNKGDVVFVNTGDVQEGRFLHSNRVPKKGLPGQAKKAIAKGDILYSEIRPKNKRFAYVNFDSEDYVVSTKFMIINPKDNILSKLLYRILTMQSTVDNLNSIAEGRSGTFPQITFDAISDIEFVVPPLSVQQKFQEIISPMEMNQDELYLENQTLTQLRDTLLPKLISGEVRVKDVEKTLTEVL